MYFFLEQIDMTFENVVGRLESIIVARHFLIGELGLDDYLMKVCEEFFIKMYHILRDYNEVSDDVFLDELFVLDEFSFSQMKVEEITEIESKPFFDPFIYAIAVLDICSNELQKDDYDESIKTVLKLSANIVVLQSEQLGLDVYCDDDVDFDLACGIYDKMWVLAREISKLLPKNSKAVLIDRDVNRTFYEDSDSIKEVNKMEDKRILKRFKTYEEACEYAKSVNGIVCDSNLYPFTSETYVYDFLVEQEVYCDLIDVEEEPYCVRNHIGKGVM